MPDRSELDLNSPENRYRSDYINELKWLEINLDGLEKDPNFSFDKFKKLCEDIISGKGKAVKGYAERYKIQTVPDVLKDRVKITDEIADKINEALEKFLNSGDKQDQIDLKKLIDDAIKLIKS